MRQVIAGQAGHLDRLGGGDCVAARKGLEPLTFALGKRCSILLSYRAATRLPSHNQADGVHP